MTIYWFALFSAVALGVLGQTLLKAGASAPGLFEQLFDWRTLSGLFVYGFAALLDIIALRRIPISIAVPRAAVSYVAAALIGRFWFAEALGAAQIGGISLIVIGVLLMAFRSQI